MNRKEKDAKMCTVLDAATEKLVRGGFENGFDIEEIAKASVTIPFAILFSVVKPGNEARLGPVIADMVSTMAQSIGNNSNEIAAEIKKQKIKDGAPYDGPLKAEDVPEDIQKALKEFFNQ